MQSTGVPCQHLDRKIVRAPAGAGETRSKNWLELVSCTPGAFWGWVENLGPFGAEDSFWQKKVTIDMVHIKFGQKFWPI